MVKFVPGVLYQDKITNSTFRKSGAKRNKNLIINYK